MVVGSLIQLPHRRFTLPLYVILMQMAFFSFYVIIGDSFDGYRNNVCQWDCLWYQGIAQGGYMLHPNAAGFANWAFFPLLPLLSRLLMDATGKDFVTTGSAINAVAFFALVMTSVSYFRRCLGGRDPYFAAFVFLAFPFGIYFRIPYTEALFGLSTISALLAARQGQMLLAGICAGIGCACRPTGILVVAAIGFCDVIELISAIRHTSDGVQQVLRRLTTLLGFGLIGVTGLVIYSIFLRVHVGDALAFSHAQAAWGRHFGDPIARVASGLRAHDMKLASFISHGGRSETYLAVSVVMSLPLVVWAYTQRAMAAALFLLGTLLLSASTGLESEPRYMFCNPVMIALIASVMERLPTALRWSVALLFAALQIILVLAWFHHSAFLT